jgi:hypothetical protein
MISIQQMTSSKLRGSSSSLSFRTRRCGSKLATSTLTSSGGAILTSKLERRSCMESASVSRYIRGDTVIRIRAIRVPLPERTDPREKAHANLPHDNGYIDRTPVHDGKQAFRTRMGKSVQTS